jgi:hypothetical protein
MVENFRIAQTARRAIRAGVNHWINVVVSILLLISERILQ